VYFATTMTKKEVVGVFVLFVRRFTGPVFVLCTIADYRDWRYREIRDGSGDLPQED
jgi:hypothetical protein